MSMAIQVLERGLSKHVSKRKRFDTLSIGFDALQTFGAMEHDFQWLGISKAAVLFIRST